MEFSRSVKAKVMIPGRYELRVIRVTQTRLSDIEAIEMTLRDILAVARRKEISVQRVLERELGELGLMRDI